jgi:iron complex transport system substrate-binding protein
MMFWRCAQKTQVVLLGLFAFAFQWEAWGRPLVDQIGNRTELVEKPVRVVTAAPSLAELAADVLGPELDRIVGVSEFTNFPPSLSKRPSVGPFFKLNLERIVSLKPDLVLATRDGNSKDEIKHLRELGLPVVVLSTQSLAEVAVSMEIVADALGAPERGKKMAEQLRSGIQRFKERASLRKVSPKVLLQVGMDPLVVAGSSSFVSDAVGVTGVLNVYADSKSAYPRPSLEDVLIRNPDVILLVAMDQASFKSHEREGRNWREFPSLSAVKNGKIFVLPGDRILRPSLGLLEGIALIERTLFP